MGIRGSTFLDATEQPISILIGPVDAIFSWVVRRFKSEWDGLGGFIDICNDRSVITEGWSVGVAKDSVYG